MFRCRHFIHKHLGRIEHFTENEVLPPDTEYFDSELSCIDRVLYIRDAKNTEANTTANFPENASLYEKITLTLSCPLLQYFYSPYQIYLMQVYVKGVDGVNEQKKLIDMSEAHAEERVTALEATLQPLIDALPTLVNLPATQRLVLVKWNNQSYDQVTWELEEDVKHEQSKILTFYRNNRLPDTHTLVSPFRYDE